MLNVVVNKIEQLQLPETLAYQCAYTSCLSDFLLFLLSCETYETEIPSEAFQGDPREAFLRAALGTAIVWLGLEGSALLWTA